MTLNPYIEAHELRELVLKKEVRPREVAEFFLARVEQLNPRLGAFMTVTAERALADASRLEKLNASDAAMLPLFGVAYSLKDLLWTRDIRTTFGSKNYENWHAPADAELAVRLANSGGILLGKTTTPEFGLRPTTEGGLCPPARNPWNPRTHRRRLQRRLRLRRRLRNASRGAGQRRRRIDSHTFGMLRRGRNQTVARTNHTRAAGGRSMERTFDHRPDRAHRPRRGADARCDGGNDAGRSVRGTAAGASIRRRSFGASKKTSARRYQP